MSQRPIKHVAILMAMEAEAEPLIQALNLQQKESPFPSHLPMQFFQAIQDELVISLVTSGKDHRFDVDLIGPVPAAVYAYITCQYLKPDMIYSAGTAGGFAKNADIGTVFLSQDHCVFHDRIVPLPGFQQSSIGHFPVLNVSEMAKALQLKTGVVSTGSSLERQKRDLEFMVEHQAVAKEMEAASIAWVCSLFQLPFVAVKSITNLLDHEATSEAQFVENLQKASHALHEAMIKIIDYCKGKSIEDLASRLER